LPKVLEQKNRQRAAVNLSVTESGSKAKTGVRFQVLLAVTSGILLGFSFPPSPLYSLAYIAFIPLFVLVERLKSYRQLFSSSYVFLFVFHVITLYWTGGWTHGRDPWLMTSNAALLLAHPFFYFPTLFISFFVWRKLGTKAGLAAFAFLWIGYEYSHSLSEFSFPWITIGNSQAYDLYRSQIVEYTSAYGLSFLLLAFNSVAFLLMTNLVRGRWRIHTKPAVVCSLVLLFLYLGPLVYGAIKRQELMEGGAPRALKIAVIQPNFDPWEKWGEGFTSKWDSYQTQLATYLEATRQLFPNKPDLVVWPETAVPFPILTPRFSFALPSVLGTIDSLRCSVFTGLHHIEYVDSTRASATAQKVGGGLYAESYNSAIFIEPGRKLSSVYKKIVLVPFAERIPYAETLKFLIEPLKWNVGISSWGKGRDTLVYTMRTRSGDTVCFGGMICYESVYPNFVRAFVAKGAEFLVVITNDSWWGNTSGAYQHACYASLRAIENRRWVVQSSNGGISEFVDPYGNIFSPTKMFTSTKIVRHIEPGKELTFYTKYGDVFAQLCLFCSLPFVILALRRTMAAKV
jgi:apolipoprotein N-acyltransferase